MKDERAMGTMIRAAIQCSGYLDDSVQLKTYEEAIPTEFTELQDVNNDVTVTVLEKDCLIPSRRQC